MVTIKRERMRNLNRSLRGWDASQSCHVCRAAGLGGNSGSAGFCHGATMPDAEDGAAGAHPAGCGGGAMSAGPSICCGPGCCWAALAGLLLAGLLLAGLVLAVWAWPCTSPSPSPSSAEGFQGTTPACIMPHNKQPGAKA